MRLESDVIRRNKAEFDPIAAANKFHPAYGVEDNAALVFENERLVGSLSAGGTAYELTFDGDHTNAVPIPLL